MFSNFLRKNPNQVDTRTVRVLMEVAELHRKHLGGQLLFSPDGLLHIILGDGMITLDDMEEMDGLRWDHKSEDHVQMIVSAIGVPKSECFWVVKVFLVCVFECSDFTGSVLRVDVDTDCCTSPYSIPRNNPYFNSTNQPPEIFAHGLHDPGRWVKHVTRNFINIVRPSKLGYYYLLSFAKSIINSVSSLFISGILYWRCAVDRLQTDNGSLLILCTDASGKNSSSGRILEITKGKDYGELHFPWKLIRNVHKRYIKSSLFLQY